MRVFGRPKFEYSPLLVPKFGLVPMPNMRVMQREGKVVGVIISTVLENLDRLGVDGVEREMSGLPQLRKALVAALTTHRGQSKEAIELAVVPILAAGWFVGEMENASGVARPGMSCAHYWSAMVGVSTVLNRHQDESLGAEREFSLLSGYYVSRSGLWAIDRVITASSDPAER